MSTVDIPARAWCRFAYSTGTTHRPSALRSCRARRDHRDASVDVTEDLRLRRGFAEPVRELGEALMQVLPERHAVLDGWGHVDRAEAGEVLVPDPAVDAAGLDEAHPEAVLGLAEADEHVVAAYRSAP